MSLRGFLGWERFCLRPSHPLQKEQFPDVPICSLRECIRPGLDRGRKEGWGRLCRIHTWGRVCTLLEWLSQCPRPVASLEAQWMLRGPA